jgi:hypothetical protein
MNLNNEPTPETTPAPEPIGWVPSAWQEVLHDVRTDVAGLGASEEQLADAATAQLVTRVLPEDADDDAVSTVADEATRVADAFGRGLFARLLNGPQEAEGGPAWARSVVRAVEQGNDLDELRSLTGGDPDMAALATSTIVRTVAGQLQRVFESLDRSEADPVAEPEPAPEQPEPVEPGTEPSPGSAAGPAIPAESDPDPIELAADRLQRAVSFGIGRALREVADAKAELDGFLPGLGDADEITQPEDPRRLALLERLRDNPRLRLILQIAGRVLRVANQTRQVPSEDVRVELAGLERGADLARVLPSELAGLRAARGLRLLTLKGIADRGLLQRRLTGKERLGRGPMVVLLDASDSMDAPLALGLDRQGWAAAIAIAVVRAGLEQRRAVTVGVFDFNLRAEQTWSVPIGDRTAAEAAVFGICAVRSGGGTSFSGPITWGLDSGAERDKADLILVTDGMATVGHEVEQRLVAARERGLRLWGVIAGSGGFHGTLDRIADGVTVVTGDPEQDGIASVGTLGAL